MIFVENILRYVFNASLDFIYKEINALKEWLKIVKLMKLQIFVKNVLMAIHSFWLQKELVIVIRTIIDSFVIVLILLNSKLKF